MLLLFGPSLTTSQYVNVSTSGFVGVTSCERQGDSVAA